VLVLNYFKSTFITILSRGHVHPIKARYNCFMSAITRLILLLSFFIFSGCEIQPVKPWERDLLAKPSMQLTPDEVENALDEHIYFSKEASTGGQSIGGGGCGCN